MCRNTFILTLRSCDTFKSSACPPQRFCCSAQANVQHTHPHMFSVAPGAISHQDGVEVATHMAVHVQDAITRRRGDDTATKTFSSLRHCCMPVSSIERVFILIVMRATVRFVERVRLLRPLRGWQVCRQTQRRREETKNALFATALSSLSQASLPSLLINEGKQGRGGN